MTAFKFGKSKKSKENAAHAAAAAGAADSSTFSPGSSSRNNTNNTSSGLSSINSSTGTPKTLSNPNHHSPHTSATSSSSQNQRSSKLPGTPYGNPGGGPQEQINRFQGHPASAPQHQQYPPQHQQHPQQLAGGSPYDAGNNQVPQRSPQRQNHAQHLLFGGTNPRSSIQQAPPHLASPWSRSKLLISPFPRYRHAASAYANEKGEILVMGGLHNTSVYGDTWIIKTDRDAKNFQSTQLEIYDSSPAPRVGHASTLCGNAYVIFGGDTVTNEAGEIDNDLYLFNMNSHSWTIPRPVGAKPAGRYGHSIGVIAITNFDSKLYLYGGQLDDVVYNDLVVFNLSSFRRPDVHWEWIKPQGLQPPPLTNHTMSVYDNKLWIFGGSNGKRISDVLYTYDPQLNRWEQVKTLGCTPQPVEEHAAVVYKDLLIVYGGKDSNGEAVNDLHLFNFVTKTWFKFPHNLGLEPAGKYGHSLTVLPNDKLLILGGHLPEYANFGDDLEPSNEDNGLGSILSILDLTNIEKYVPGLQQYSTPNRAGQDRFTGQQAIFTPPNSQPQAKSLSPEALQHQYAYAEHQQKNTQQINTPQTEKSLNSSTTPKSQIERQYSAEEAFQRDVSGPNSLHSNHSKLRIPQNPVQNGSSPEEELPLQIPSPIKSSRPELSSINTSEKTVNASQRSLQKPPTEDDFQTPSSSPIDSLAQHAAEASKDVEESGKPLKPAGYFNNNGRNSNFLDSYVNSHSASDILENDQIGQTKRDISLSSEHTTGSRNFSVSDYTTGAATVATVASVGATKLTSTPRIDDAKLDDKNEFRQIVDSLTKELNQLKLSTNEEIKSASEKVRALEFENSELKQKLGVNGTFTDSRDLKIGNDDSEIKRANVKLNADYQLLKRNHTQLKSQFSEIQPIFSENLINLAQLTGLVKQQSTALEESQKELQEQQDWKLKHDELEGRYRALESRLQELSDSRKNDFVNSHQQITLLNTNLQSFLNSYSVTDQETGALSSRDLNTTADNEELTNSLREQIEELLKENETAHASQRQLKNDIFNLQSKASEVELLKARLAELSKIEENYRESLHSVKNASRALQISQSDLNKEREITTQLKQEIDELKIFKAKKSSRVSTPILNDSEQLSTKKFTGDDDEDDDIENAHYNLKIRDLQAELFITKQERDELKDDVLSLKKKMFAAGSGNSPR